MKITLNEFSGRYMVDGISGKSFGTRSAAERAYSALMAKQTRTSPPVTVSFVLGLNERNRLCEIADKKGLSLSKLIKLIVEKEIQNYEKQE